MFKKIIAISVVLTSIFTQIAFANNDNIILISSYNDDVKTEFYKMFSTDNYADVFYNGEYIAFDDVQPLVLNGTTFVPIRTFCDTIGAEISFVDETFEVIISNGEDRISFVVGSADINVNGEIVTLNTETFLFNARTMVPVRLISEAFDLDVTWNNIYQQVSIVDVNALKEGIDTDFTLMNSVLAMTTSDESTKNSMLTGEFIAKTGELGSESTISAEFTSIASNDFSSVDFSSICSLDTSKLESEIETALQEGLLDQATVNVLLESVDILKEFDLNFVLDTQSFDLYVWSEDISIVSEIFWGQSEVTANDVIKFSYADLLKEDEFATLQNKILSAIAGEKQYTVESLIDDKLAQSTYVNLFDSNIYAQAEAMWQGLKDENFSKSTLTYSLSNSALIDDMQVDYQIEIKVNYKGDVLSYSIDYAYADALIGDLTFISISQDDEDEISLLLNQKSLDTSTGLYSTLAIDCKIKRSETTKMPSEIPTENIVEILSLS
ncbi:MAG: copper amine oxidase N-terminal domain-containing protein [Clostridia bacterium]